ncbi:hypothetical protein GCM10011273_26900 [Asticcacaulis endophyticus]|uniref:Uncharacterized protein n=1 Tax=Asticcacaulis endophyticus TaxID=1395890 RepID=A0A918QAD6_9CAUL|nr:hypothetical protein GCM10011273_26900 [Asticcacaulis endophyticus]
MAIFTKDGLTLLPEIMDRAILTSNLIDEPLKGRAQITDFLRALETIYVSATDIYRAETHITEIIVTRVLLATGTRLTVIIIGTRDCDGWISGIAMDHQPHSNIAGISRLLSALMSPTPT